MSSQWEPGIAQMMQRHGGSHRSRPKIVAPAIAPDLMPPAQRPMAMQGDPPLAPEMPRAPEETWD